MQQLQNSECESKKISLPNYPIVNSEVNFFIDSVTSSCGKTNLRGWACHKNDICRVYVEANGDIYEATTESRPDVQKSLGLDNDKQGFALTISGELCQYSLNLVNDEKREIYKVELTEQKKEVVTDQARYCRYAWNRMLNYTESGKLMNFCCYMPFARTVDNKGGMFELMEKYPIPKGLSLEDTYNCKSYWQYRKDMLDGKLLDFCKDCQMRNLSYDDLISREADIENYVPYC